MDVKSKNKKMDMLKVKHYLNTRGTFQNHLFKILAVNEHMYLDREHTRSYKKSADIVPLNYTGCIESFHFAIRILMVMELIGGFAICEVVHIRVSRDAQRLFSFRKGGWGNLTNFVSLLLAVFTCHVFMS